MEAEIIILNPRYTLRHDMKRSFIFSNDTIKHTNKYQFTKEWNTKIHPVQAMILSFFSHNLPYNEVKEKLGYFLDMSSCAIDEMIKPYINNPAPFYTEYQGRKFFFPANVLIVVDKAIDKLIEYEAADFVYSELDFKSKRMIEAPLNITLMLNNVCATNCEYCYADIRNRDNCKIPFPTIKHVIKQSKELKIAEFGLLGGEVFLYPYWFELLQEMSKNEYYPDLISTKVPLSLEQVLKLKEVITDATTLQVSLDSLIEDELFRILNVEPNYLSKIKRMFDYFEQYEIKFTVATTLTKIKHIFA